MCSANASASDTEGERRMHELSIASAVVEIACRRSEGRAVTKIVLRVGHLRQVVPSSLEFSFELVAQGTLAEGAELEMLPVPAAGLCKQCEVETHLKAFPFQCAGCGGFDLRIVAGDDLEVESIECLEESDNAPRPSENVRC
jgi:hydrogenase nickel incorporation protein HypA/HybF